MKILAKTLKGFSLFSVFLLLVFLFSGCEFIGDIFKAGIWVGILIVIAIIAVISFLVITFKKG